jgi:hypothetical protein
MPGGRESPRGKLVFPSGRRLPTAGRLYSPTGVIVDPYHPFYYADQYRLLLWLIADLGIQLGATLRVMVGTSVPTLTITGTPTSLVSLAVECTSIAGGTALGQAEVRWSFDDSVTFSASTVTAASIVIGNGLTLECGAGTYAVNQRWSATVAQWDDQSGNANHAVQATASRQPVYRVAQFGTNECLDYLTGTTFGLATPAIALADHSFLVAVRGNAGSGHNLVHNSESTDGSFLFGTDNCASSTYRAGVVSARSQLNWTRDAVRKVIAKRAGAMHANHEIFINGENRLADTCGGVGNDPGAATVTGPMYVGNRHNFSASLRGEMREVLVYGAMLPDVAMANLSEGIMLRAPGAF